MTFCIFLFIIPLASFAHLFYEPFVGDAIANGVWNVSTVAGFNGSWKLETRIVDFSNGTKGLVPKTPAARHAISTKQEFVAVNETFVLQFEHKVQSTSFSCGGSYVKLLNENFTTDSFSNNSPYVIMFGPDKCAGTNLIHFIYRTQNPLSQVWSEHKLKTKIPGLYDNITHLYTLVINSNDTFEIKIDNVVKTSGNLHDSQLFDTPFEPPQLIPDAADKKPADWVDEAEIPDPADFKPADWDENAPPTIPDPKATKPADWKEEEALEIADPKATKPATWNDAEDGAYLPATIANPYCEDHGCGPWVGPPIKNPLYKGKWSARRIPNPLYKGVWAPREIPNPYYFTPNKTLHVVGQVYGLGFELVSPGESQWFGGIFVGDSVVEAQATAKEHWEGVNAAEKEAETKRKAQEEEDRKAAAKAKAEAEAKAKAEAEAKAKAAELGYDPETQCAKAKVDTTDYDSDVACPLD